MGIAATRWCRTDALSQFHIPQWGDGFFDVNEAGHLVVLPQGINGAVVDLSLLMADLRGRGLETPILLCFPDILHRRLLQLNDLFQQAMDRYGYRGRYRCLYPLKVNPQRPVVEAVVSRGQSVGAGLEVGSMPELQAALASMTNDCRPIVCNGHKDRAFLQLALLGQRLGQQMVIVIEKPRECLLLMELATEMAVRPCIGVRLRPLTAGSGRWKASSGPQSKFGLNASELFTVLQLLRQKGYLECVTWLHGHVGSQISTITTVRAWAREAAYSYVDLRRWGCPIETVDLGGGLGIDYTGVQQLEEDSIDYNWQDYADTIVAQFAAVCGTEQMPQPHLVTESGRAITAHHAILMTSLVPMDLPVTAPAELDWPHEMLPDGQIRLAQRLRMESSPQPGGNSREFVNFSVFQSLPDSWALGQIFPVVPIQQLLEPPSRWSSLYDLTCDSDGQLSRFCVAGAIGPQLPLPTPRPGVISDVAILLVGAYQTVLGGYHNLFGRPSVVEVGIDAAQQGVVRRVWSGQTALDVLTHALYDATDLQQALHRMVWQAKQQGRLDVNELLTMEQWLQESLHNRAYLRME
ncbi:MAG: biosynthetic arginine decarboxylase [Magnetococcales bacterium]|nr:biosynthetic arginine decarboxylase [Magnetococcales bacterium]